MIAFPLHAVALLLATGISLTCAVLAWRRRSAPGARQIGLLMLAVAWWELFSALGALAIDVPGKLLWAKVQYLGIASSPVLWALFAYRYLFPDRPFRSRWWWALWIPPALTVAVAATNDLHGLLWSRVELIYDGLGTRGQFFYGPWFWLYVAYSYTLLAIGTGLLIRALTRFAPQYWRRSAVVLAGVALPWLGNAAYLAKLVPVPGQDITPFAFTGTGLAFLWSFFHQQILDLVPVARERLIEQLSDGVIVADTQGRLLDANPAARAMLGLGPGGWVGAPVEDLLPSWMDRVPMSGGTLRAPLELGTGPRARTYDVRVTPLHDSTSAHTGFLGTLRDVTEQVRQNRRREALLRAARRLASESDSNQMLSHLLREAVELVGGESGVAARWDPDQMVLRVVGSIDVPGPPLALPLDSGLLSQAAVRKAPVAMHGGSAWLGAGSAVAEAALAVPLLHEGVLLGVVGVAAAQGGAQFTQDDADSLEVLASVATGALIGVERAKLAGVLLAARTAEHEVNNRLAVTVGYAELLTRDHSLSEKSRTMAQMTLQGARSAAEVIEQLRQVTRLEEHDWGDEGQNTIDLARSAQ